eukprot:jgi/Tetstr1/444987/TSEL_032796.t1
MLEPGLQRSALHATPSFVGLALALVALVVLVLGLYRLTVLPLTILLAHRYLPRGGCLGVLLLILLEMCRCLSLGCRGEADLEALVFEGGEETVDGVCGALVLGGVEDAGLYVALRDLLFAGECLLGLEAA